MVAASSESTLPSGTPATGTPPLIFLIDDDRDTVQTLAAILESEGYSVFGFYRGPEALHAMRRRKPDALIVDIDLPGPSGYAIARDIRSDYGDDSPLLIGISGKWVKQTDRLLGEVVGFDHYCLKPCEPDHLLKLLEPLRHKRPAPPRAPGL
jgi:DNA-binding response OmpR family regulator